MRLCRLALLRFGPFTDAELAFDSRGGRLEIVYGPNEAGKSTTLRAVSGLLYGIPERTSDDHLHPMRELRVRGELRAADGQTLEIERLKRRKNSLLSPDGEPLDENVLTRFLGGVTQSAFTYTFGLNHVTLREGADALLAGRGDIGQSLFDAAMGGAGALSVLTELEEEADDLYSPRARSGKRVVDRALAEYATATERLKQAVTFPQSFLDQKQELEKKREELARVEEGRRALHAEKEKLRFTRAAVPLLAERERIVRELEVLGSVPVLSEDAPLRRERIVREREMLRQEIVHIEAALASHQEKRQRILVPKPLRTLDAERVEDLQYRLGEYHKAQVDLPKRRARLKELEAEAERLKGRLPAESTVLGAATKERISVLALGHGELAAAVTRSKRDLDELREEIQEKDAALAHLGPEDGGGELARAVESAQESGDLERARTDLERENRRARALDEAPRARYGRIPG